MIAHPNRTLLPGAQALPHHLSGGRALEEGTHGGTGGMPAHRRSCQNVFTAYTPSGFGEFECKQSRFQ